MARKASNLKKKNKPSKVKIIKYFKKEALRKVEDELNEMAARYERWRKDFTARMMQKTVRRSQLLSKFQKLVIFPNSDKLQQSMTKRFEVYNIVEGLIEADQHMDQNFAESVLRHEKFARRVREHIMSESSWSATTVRDVDTQRGTSEVKFSKVRACDKEVPTQTQRFQPASRTSTMPDGVSVTNGKQHGFCSDVSGNPRDLVKAVDKLRALLTSFSRRFWVSVRSRSIQNTEAISPLDSWYSGIHFIRVQHVVSYGLKACINEGLFKNFENEDFGGGMIRTFDSYIRWKLASEDDGNKSLEVERFSAFRLKKLRWLVKKFRLLQVSPEDTVVEPEQVLGMLGGPSLLSEFDSVAREIWEVHRLAFSFACPATILRFERSCAVNREYMNVIEDFEDEQLVTQVGFTVSPGFRLGNTIIKAEIYPSGEK
ncbi:hypothetical protein R1flu_020481 [Riccia fluitans]|uniref:GIL1/IRKI C-terminal domain-containing protein n=1 Tax=Riccia fluitans TaxID=41844 RepID=A0ABD1ZLV5_9MARC